MAATCTAAGLITAGNCFTNSNFSHKDQKAILAYLWWQWGNSVGAPVYETVSQILVASECIAEGLSNDQQTAALIGVLNRGADGLGSLSPALEITALTAATAATAIACLKNATNEQLDGIILFNICRFFGALTS